MNKKPRRTVKYLKALKAAKEFNIQASESSSNDAHLSVTPQLRALGL